MTDAEFIDAQHRIIVNHASCTCNLEWKHGTAQPMCPKCMIVVEYYRRVGDYEAQT
jgi:hypothetical protein